MARVTFSGTITISETNLEPFDFNPNSETVVELTSGYDAVLHSVYVSNPNPVTVTITIEPMYPQQGRPLKFKGIFGNETKPVPFFPPIGPFREGKIRVRVEAPDTATKPVTVVFQFTVVRG